MVDSGTMVGLAEAGRASYWHIACLSFHNGGGSAATPVERSQPLAARAIAMEEEEAFFLASSGTVLFL